MEKEVGPRLSLFGNPDELEYFGDDDDDKGNIPEPSTSTGFGSTLGVCRPKILSRDTAVSIFSKGKARWVAIIFAVS